MNRQPLLLLSIGLLQTAIAFQDAFGQVPRSTVSEGVVTSTVPHASKVLRLTSCRQDLDDAKLAFKNGDEAGAFDRVNEGLVKCPWDLELVEFRGLVLFAKRDYHAASIAIHQVMQSKPGWNWATVHSLYPNVDTYTRHLRTLEEFTKKHPDDGPARFLQAYHYKVGGHVDEAIRELEMVVRLEVSDPVAAELKKKLFLQKLNSPAPTGPVNRY